VQQVKRDVSVMKGLGRAEAVGWVSGFGIGVSNCSSVMVPRVSFHYVRELPRGYIYILDVDLFHLYKVRPAPAPGRTSASH
jgi:hypothetical protein